MSFLRHLRRATVPDGHSPAPQSYEVAHEFIDHVSFAQAAAHVQRTQAAEAGHDGSEPASSRDGAAMAIGRSVSDGWMPAAYIGSDHDAWSLTRRQPAREAATAERRSAAASMVATEAAAIGGAPIDGEAHTVTAGQQVLAQFVGDVIGAVDAATGAATATTVVVGAGTTPHAPAASTVADGAAAQPIGASLKQPLGVGWWDAFLALQPMWQHGVVAAHPTSTTTATAAAAAAADNGATMLRIDDVDGSAESAFFTSALCARDGGFDTADSGSGSQEAVDDATVTTKSPLAAVADDLNAGHMPSRGDGHVSHHHRRVFPHRIHDRQATARSAPASAAQPQVHVITGGGGFLRRLGGRLRRMAADRQLRAQRAVAEGGYKRVTFAERVRSAVDSSSVARRMRQLAAAYWTRAEDGVDKGLTAASAGLPFGRPTTNGKDDYKRAAIESLLAAIDAKVQQTDGSSCCEQAAAAAGGTSPPFHGHWHRAVPSSLIIVTARPADFRGYMKRKTLETLRFMHLGHVIVLMGSLFKSCVNCSVRRLHPGPACRWR